MVSGGYGLGAVDMGMGVEVGSKSLEGRWIEGRHLVAHLASGFACLILLQTPVQGPNHDYRIAHMLHPVAHHAMSLPSV